MKGVVLAGGSGTRLRPLTQVTSKQLLPVFDKPMIYYPLSTLMHAGVDEVLIISTPIDTPRIQDLLGGGSQFGITIKYLVQEKPEGLAQGVNMASSFANGENFWFILGDNFFHGPAFGANLKDISKSHKDGSLIFAYRVLDPRSYGVVTFDEESDEIKELVEKPQVNKPGWAIPGLYLFDAKASLHFQKIRPSSRGELEIIDLLDEYRISGALNVQKISRGNAWFDLGSVESLQIGAQFVQAIQSRQGQLIGSPEEAAVNAGYLSDDVFQELLRHQPQSAYYDLLRSYLN
jgi:glucose-1-phosphate thymidylyltransferase